MAFLSFPSPTQLRNLTDPSSSQDAATKAYVDAALSGGSGTLSVGNISATGNISAGGNITASNANLGNVVVANYFIGNGSLITNIPASAITGQTANANYAAYAGNITIAAQPNITSVGTLTSLAVTGLVNLGNISNVKISGGTANYVLRTDGTGNLAWSAPSTPILSGDVDEFTGDGTTTAFSLSVTPASKNVTFVVLQGVMQPKSSYTVSGAVLTFSTAPPNTAFIEVTTMKIG